MTDEFKIEPLPPLVWVDGDIEVFTNGLARNRKMTPAEYRNLYLCEYPLPPKVGDGAMWKGRAVIIRAIEPGGEKNRATVQDAETGRTREVDLSALVSI